MILLNEPDGFPAATRARLARCAPVVTPQDTFDPAQVEAIFVRLAERIDDTFLARFPMLHFLVTPTTGLNHLDRAALERRRVDVLSLAGRTEFLDRIHATAEHTIALALSLLRRLPDAALAVRAGAWDRYPFKGGELARSTVFILGYGRLGRQVRGLYTAFGAQVVAHDPIPGRVPQQFSVSREDGLARADLLSIHVNLTDETTGLLGKAEFSRMKRGAMLVNTSRGEIIDQTALFDSIRTGHLAGAALDVLWDEPDPLSPAVRAALQEFGPRLVVTPHISGFTHNSLERVEDFMAQCLEEAWARKGNA